MIKQFMKLILFVALITPLASFAMESKQDKIALGKQLVEATEDEDWYQVEKLIDQKADLNQTAQYEHGRTALMLVVEMTYIERAIQKKIIQKLINACADLNLQDDYGYTALMYAVENDDQEIIEMLINAHVDLSLQNKNGYTALRVAVGWDYLSTCHTIVEGMLKQNNEQKTRIYSFLLCLKRISGFAGTNQAKHLFKPILLPTITDVHQEIDRIPDSAIRTQLLEKYDFRPISNSEVQQ